MGPAAAVPEQPLVGEAPAVLVLAEEVGEGVGVEAGALGAHAEHHARAEDAARQVQLPEEAAVVEDAGAAHARRAAAPVRVEVRYPEVVAVQAHLGAPVVPVPRPQVLAPVPQGDGVRFRLHFGCGTLRLLCGGAVPSRGRARQPAKDCLDKENVY